MLLRNPGSSHFPPMFFPYICFVATTTTSTSICRSFAEFRLASSILRMARDSCTLSTAFNRNRGFTETCETARNVSFRRATNKRLRLERIWNSTYALRAESVTRPWSIEEHRCYRIFGVDYANRCKPAEIEIIRAGNENQSSVEIILGSRALEIVY